MKIKTIEDWRQFLSDNRNKLHDISIPIEELSCNDDWIKSDEKCKKE